MVSLALFSLMLGLVALFGREFRRDSSVDQGYQRKLEIVAARSRFSADLRSAREWLSPLPGASISWRRGRPGRIWPDPLQPPPPGWSSAADQETVTYRVAGGLVREVAATTEPCLNGVRTLQVQRLNDGRLEVRLELEETPTTEVWHMELPLL